MEWKIKASWREERVISSCINSPPFPLSISPSFLPLLRLHFFSFSTLRTSWILLSSDQSNPPSTTRQSIIQWHSPPQSPAMPNSVYLPTEIVVYIVSLAAQSSDEAQRQSTLYACCLVSQQWYSAAVSFLYRKPRLKTGRSFAKFTRTVAPPLGERKSKLNLGEFVHRLDLGSLVHESSKSLTARLLGRIKTNLESFVAPSLSFSSVTAYPTDNKSPIPHTH